MQEKILAIIYDALQEINEDLEIPELNDPGPDTRLYSKDGGMDSLAIVNLTVLIEERISDELDKDIVIADERALSQKKSPFTRVKHLANYIGKRLNEAGDE